jgi:hypothetical protein
MDVVNFNFNFADDTWHRAVNRWYVRTTEARLTYMQLHASLAVRRGGLGYPVSFRSGLLLVLRRAMNAVRHGADLAYLGAHESGSHMASSS